jgi:hypothetical protein
MVGCRDELKARLIVHNHGFMQYNHTFAAPDSIMQRLVKLLQRLVKFMQYLHLLLQRLRSVHAVMRLGACCHGLLRALNGRNAGWV